MTKGFDGKTLFKDLSFTLEVGERLAVIGANGIGKTTLLNCMTETIEADSGSIKWSENANVAYFKQDNMADFKENITAFDWMMQFKHPDDDEQAVRSVMGRLLFSKEDSRKKLNVLSGGEKVRCMLSKMMLAKANFLMMDEPTNHLDLESITALNNAMIDFRGSMLFTSHDQALVNTVANRIIELTPKGMIDKMMTYDDYIADPKIAQLQEELY